MPSVPALPRPFHIVIVNFNGGAHVERCLRSIATHGPAARVVVVDNASTDGSAEACAGHASVRLIRNATNVGFGAAANQGMAACPQAEPVLLLNPDCEITAGALEHLHAELATHPTCGIAAPRVLDKDGTIQGNVRGDPTMLTGLFGRTSLLTRLLPQTSAARRNVQTGDGRETESRSVDWVSGACMLLRRTAFDEVGGFDERYFLYWEDADLCRRVRGRGHSVRFVPSAVVVHVGGQSSATAQALSIRAFHQSAFLYYRTHVARNPMTRTIARVLLAARCRWRLTVERAERA